VHVPSNPVLAPDTSATKGSTDLIKPRSVGRVPGLDGLRGATVIIVFVSHMEVILPIPRLAVVPGGTVSLDSFFVLSGFLITALMLREQARTDGVNTAWFYRRRAIRLLPPLIAVLVAQAVFAYVSGVSYHEEWTSLSSVMFYYSNWKLALNSNALGGTIAPGLQHLWSLALEEQFYLIWPWVTIYFLSIRARLKTVVIVLVSLIVVISVHRALMYHGASSWYADFIRTDTRADGILLGCLVAHLWIRGREPKRAVMLCGWLALLFLVICLPLVNTTAPFLFYGGIDAIDLACAFLILALIDGRWKGSKFFSFRGFVILGTVSYAFYLWHLPIFFAIRYYGGGWAEWVRVVVAVTATLTMTALSWLLIERPALEWKDRLEGHRPVERLSLRSFFRGPSASAPAPALESEALEPTAGGDDRSADGAAHLAENAVATGEEDGPPPRPSNSSGEAKGQVVADPGVTAD
jgi:peptidoglycan/LPS O-acetylase OafA/YrhL